MEFPDHKQRVFFCPSCSIGRYSYTQNEIEYCTRCGRQTTDSCPQCNALLKDPDGIYCHCCGHHLLSKNKPLPSGIDLNNPNSSQHSFPTKLELYPSVPPQNANKNVVTLSNRSNNVSVVLNKACFDFIYYISWLEQNSKPRIQVYQEMPIEHKQIICPRHRQQARFDAKWVTDDIRSKTHYIWQVNEKLGLKILNRTGAVITVSSKVSITLHSYKN